MAATTLNQSARITPASVVNGTYRPARLLSKRIGINDVALPSRFQYAEKPTYRRGTKAVQIFATQCKSCGGIGQHSIKSHVELCVDCDGKGYFGINPHLPTICPPGTYEKMIVMRIRDMGEDPVYLDDDATLEDVNIDLMNWTPIPSLHGHSVDCNGITIQSDRYIPQEDGEDVIEAVCNRELKRIKQERKREGWYEWTGRGIIEDKNEEGQRDTDADSCGLANEHEDIGTGQGKNAQSELQAV